MARPTKAGLNYFPFDVYDCRGVKLIEAKFGLAGFAVITKLLQAVYGGMGYFCPLDQETLLLFASECRLSEETIADFDKAAVHWEIFDREKYESCQILTSLEIQKCYLTAVGRRHRIDFDSRYLLLPPELLTDNIWIDGVFCIGADENSMLTLAVALDKTTPTKTWSGITRKHRRHFTHSIEGSGVRRVGLVLTV